MVFVTCCHEKQQEEISAWVTFHPNLMCTPVQCGGSGQAYAIYQMDADVGRNDGGVTLAVGSPDRGGSHRHQKRERREGM